MKIGLKEFDTLKEKNVGEINKIKEKLFVVYIHVQNSGCPSLDIVVPARLMNAIPGAISTHRDP